MHIGKRIGDFVIERELGRGGMGIVYSAVHEKTAERVAIKVLSPHLLPQPRQRRRFQREAYAATQIQHDGLVRVLGHGEADQAEPYILMEYLDGTSLRQAMQLATGNRFSIEAARRIAIQLADVLDSAHKSGLLHRDLKPSNVMLLGEAQKPERCRVKLLDFGLARLITEGEVVTGSEGEVLGTPAYMSPEQCEGKADLDGCSDVYGLGALLFEMLCGRTPFVGTPPRMMYQHVYQPAPAPEKYRSEVSVELSTLVGKMLAKAPSQRPTMGEVAAQLREHCKNVELLPPAPIRVDASRVSDKARLWIGVLGLVNVALAASLYREVSHRLNPAVAPSVAPAPPSPPSRPLPPPAQLDLQPAATLGVPAPATTLQPRAFLKHEKHPAPRPEKGAAPVEPHAVSRTKDGGARSEPSRASPEPKPKAAAAQPAAPAAAPQPDPAGTLPAADYWR